VRVLPLFELLKEIDPLQPVYLAYVISEYKVSGSSKSFPYASPKSRPCAKFSTLSYIRQDAPVGLIPVKILY
jgi:hypothetical protein